MVDALAETIGVPRLKAVKDDKQLLEIALATFVIARQACLQSGLTDQQTTVWLTRAISVEGTFH